MRRHRVRALVIAFICILTIASSAWSRNRVNYVLRRGHPNDHKFTSMMASANYIIIPMLWSPLQPMSIILRWDDSLDSKLKRVDQRKLSPTNQPTTGGK